MESALEIIRPSGQSNPPRQRYTEEVESWRKQVSRFRARSLSAQELADFYRRSLFALCQDGTIADSQFYKSGDRLVEKEINALRQSYEEEIRLLEDEVNEVRTKLNHGDHFISELRKRFEENIKAMYKPGREQSSSNVLDQFENLSQALEQSQAEATEACAQLALEKMAGRKRQ